MNNSQSVINQATNIWKDIYHLDKPSDDTVIIEALVNEPTIPNIPSFVTYEEAKKRIELGIKIPQAISRGKKRVAKLKTTKGSLMLPEGKGEDEESEESKEFEKEEEPPKKKGKVIITKPQKQPTTIFT